MKRNGKVPICTGEGIIVIDSAVELCQGLSCGRVANGAHSSEGEAARDLRH